MNNTLDKTQLETFKKTLWILQQKALSHLITKEWAHHIDGNVRIEMPRIDENGIHFELMHTMIGRLLATVDYTWEQMNELDSQTK